MQLACKPAAEHQPTQPPLLEPVAAAPPAAVVLYFHGTPSSHLEAVVLDEEARARNVAVVAVDR